MRIAVLALCLFWFGSCGNTTPAPAPDPGLARLTTWMTGTFSSEAQAAETDGYIDIRLAMVEIWPDRKDGPWLYVEQAIAKAPERPYRQRVYHLRTLRAGVYESRVYEMPEPLSHAGAWKQDAPLADLSPDDLTLKSGCGVVLRARDDGSFAGGTLGAGCATSFGGATYATSFVTVHADRIEAWDRGFDATHTAKWGPDAGPYHFRKLTDTVSKATSGE